MDSLRLSQSDLHSLFVKDLGQIAEDVHDTGRKPLLLRLAHPFDRGIRAYIFNCTAPPGGRSIDEFKIQLILDGQNRGERGRFDTSDDRTVLIIGYANPFFDVSGGIWVLFELDKHKEFAYSANVQVYLRQLLPTMEKNLHVCQKKNQEILVLSRRPYLVEAVKERLRIDLQLMIEMAEHET